jgi:hypothetical protein
VRIGASRAIASATWAFDGNRAHSPTSAERGADEWCNINEKQKKQIKFFVVV